jgi:hypothetical protein
MPFNNENKVEIGFKGILVIVLAIIAFLSIPAFSNNYPHLGWLCISTVTFVTFLWIYLADESRPSFALVIALIALAIGIIAFVGGVPQEWQRLTGQDKRTEETTAIILEVPMPNSLYITPFWGDNRT